MIKVERDRLRRLANDSIIATFGSDTTEATLAQALETCIDELDNIATECENCKTCEAHGDIESDTFDVDLGELLAIQKQLRALTNGLKRNLDNPELMAEIVAGMDSKVDELEAEIIPV